MKILVLIVFARFTIIARFFFLSRGAFLSSLGSFPPVLALFFKKIDHALSADFIIFLVKNLLLLTERAWYLWFTGMFSATHDEDTRYKRWLFLFWDFAKRNMYTFESCSCKFDLHRGYAKVVLKTRIVFIEGENLLRFL